MEKNKISQTGRRIVGYSFYIPAGYLIVTETSWKVLVGLILWTFAIEFMRMSKAMLKQKV